VKANQRVRILGVPVDTVGVQDCLELVRRCLESDGTGNHILAVNPEKIMAVRGDPLLREFFESAALLIPDGVGVVLALRWLYGIRVGRVAGADLMKRICAEAAGNGHSIYVYGGHEEVNRKAVESLRRLYPAIRVAGRCNGYVGREGRDDLIAAINRSKADILFVGLGSPKQEQWIERYLPELKVKVCQGVGGSLDVLAGNKARAPYWVQRIGLEWLYRLLREPGRIRRQIACPLFVSKVVAEKLQQVQPGHEAIGRPDGIE